jgi:hypothetical protein
LWLWLLALLQWQQLARLLHLLQSIRTLSLHQLQITAALLIKSHNRRSYATSLPCPAGLTLQQLELWTLLLHIIKQGHWAGHTQQCLLKLSLPQQPWQQKHQQH